VGVVSGTYRGGSSSVESSLPARRMTALYTYEPHPSQDVAKKDYVVSIDVTDYLVTTFGI